MELIVIGIVNTGPPRGGRFLDVQNFLISGRLPRVSLLRIRFLGRGIWLGDESVEAIVIDVGFLWHCVECRVPNTAIGSGGVCTTRPMR